MSTRKAYSKHYGPCSPLRRPAAGPENPSVPLAERRTPRDFDRTPDAVKGRAGVADASSLYHSRSALGAFHRRLKARLDAPKAITATAHKLACLIYRMLRFGSDYVGGGQDYYERRYKGGSSPSSCAALRGSAIP